MTRPHNLLFAVLLAAFATRTPAQEPPAVIWPAAVWLAPPIVLGGGVSPEEAEAVTQILARELSASIPIAPGIDGLVARLDRERASPGQLEKAKALLAKGEEAYMSFQFELSAVTLAEAAEAFRSQIAYLEQPELALLYRASLLCGLSWFEAGKAQNAKEAFAGLILIQPDFEPDPAIVSPNAREVFRQALAEIRTEGVGSVEIRSEPAGAEAYLDGKPCGKTPITVSALPAGAHTLRLSLHGYQDRIEPVLIRPPERTQSTVKLQSVPAREAAERIHAFAREGQPLEMAAADLDLCARMGRFQSLVIAGVGVQPETPERALLVTAVRWNPAGRSAAYVVTDRSRIDSDLKLLAEAILADTWPAVRLPADAPDLPLDYRSAFLGIGQSWFEARPAEEGGLFSRWWFWTGVGVIAAAATTGIYFATAGSAPRDAVRFILDFRQP